MSNLSNSDIDLRKEMNQLLSETKYSVLIQKTSKKIRCSCYSHKYQESKAKCPKCTGTGWLFKFEKVKAFKQDFTPSVSTADNGELITDLGDLSFNDKVFYLPFDSHPQTGDYIWEVTWKNGKPVSLQNLYRIKSASEQRGEKGKIEYYVAACKKEVMNKDFKNHYIGKAWRDI